MKSHQDQAKSQEYLKNYLQNWVEMSKPMMSEGVVSDYDFVLRHGKSYFYDVSSYRKSFQRQPKMCFMNAGKMALKNPDHIYVEGFVECHGVAIHHAWVVTPKGRLLDPTIRYHEGIGGYFGVPFRTEYLREATTRYNLWGLIHHQNKEIHSSDFSLSNLRT